MKLDKKLRQQVDESLESMHNEELLQILKDENERVNHVSQKSKQRSFRLLAASSCVIVFIIAIIIGGFFLFREEAVEEKHYFKDNEKQIESPLGEINLYTKYIDLEVNSDWQIKKIIDTHYNDTLYFAINGSTTQSFENFTITIVVNKDYKYNEKNVNYNKEYNLINQKVLYEEKYEIDEDGIFNFTTNAKIDTGKEILYITYEGIGTSPESNFLNSLSNILKTK